MALKFLLRGGIYLIFGIVVFGQWMRKQWQKSSDNTLTSSVSLADEDEMPDIALTSNDWRKRLWAVETIQTYQNQQDISALLPMLGDEVFDIREAAVIAISAYGKPVVPALISHLDADDADTREAVIQTLALIGNDVCMRHISQALKTDDNGWVRRAAAEALGQTHDPQYITVLSEALDTEAVRNVRDAIHNALQQIGTEVYTILEKHDPNTEKLDDESDYLILGG